MIDRIEGCLLYTSFAPAPANPTNSVYNEYTTLTENSYAAFGQVDWKLTDTLKLTGGLRYTSDTKQGFEAFRVVLFDLEAYGLGVNSFGADTPAFDATACTGPYLSLIHIYGQVVAVMRDFTQLEAVLGDYGGQEASFDWVFSPRGQDGRPEPMFDRVTGEVNPEVAAYWRDHYDIAFRLARDWPGLKPDLDGKIHVIVGTADTFYLDGAAHRLQAVLDHLGARSDFRFLDGRTHFDLYREGSDDLGLLKDITWEMYAIARPDVKRPAPAPAKS